MHKIWLELINIISKILIGLKNIVLSVNRSQWIYFGRISLVIVIFFLLAWFSPQIQMPKEDNYSEEFERELTEERRFQYIQKDSLKKLIAAIERQPLNKKVFTVSELEGTNLVIQRDSSASASKFQRIFFNSNPDTFKTNPIVMRDSLSNGVHYLRVESDVLFSMIQEAEDE